jgi:hypothetical protein
MQGQSTVRLRLCAFETFLRQNQIAALRNDPNTLGKRKVQTRPRNGSTCPHGPPRADPQSAVAVETIVSSVRMVHSSPPLTDPLLRLTTKRAETKTQSHFPSARLLDAVRTLDATISEAGVISHPFVPSFSIIQNHVSGIAPYLRDLTRAKLLKSFKTRASKIVNGKSGRTDFRNLPDAVDWNATLHLARARPSDMSPGLSRTSKKPSQHSLRELRERLTGCIGTASPWLMACPLRRPLSAPFVPWKLTRTWSMFSGTVELPHS